MLGDSRLGECQEFKTKIPQKMMTAHGKELFAFVADHMAKSGVCGCANSVCRDVMRVVMHHFNW